MTRKYKKRIRPKYKTEEDAILGARIKQREYQKKYRIKYPEKHKGKNRKKYPTQNRSLIKKVCIRDGSKCRKCGLEKNLTLQHKIPRCIGGDSKLENLEILCFKCNISEYHVLVKKALKFYFEHHSE